MIYSYAFIAEAQEEYEEALIWYLEKNEKAAEGFITAVDDALFLICSYPDRWRNEYADYHELKVKKYPFNIIYRIGPEQQLVLVTSLYHHSRDPKDKYRG